MTENKKAQRLNKLAKEFNISVDRVLSFLEDKGVKGMKPSSKLSEDVSMDLL